MPLFHGKQIKYSLSSLPTWSSSWIGKIVHVTSEDKFYYGGNSSWVLMGTQEVSLDDAYNNGRVITVDEGPVKFDATPGVNSYSPINLGNLSNAPSSNVSSGDIAVINGRLFSYDGDRNKWLSVQRDKIIFGRRIADGHYLPLIGNFATSYEGFICHYDSVIVGITAKAVSGNMSKTIRIRRNSLLSDLFVFTLSAGFYSNLNADIPVNQFDILQIYVDSAGIASRNIIVQLEIAYKA